MRKVTITLILERLDQKNHFLKGSSWFKVNYLGLALGMTLKSYASVAKRLKRKVRKCWDLIPTFAEVTGKKLVGGLFSPLFPIWNGVNLKIKPQR